MRSGRQRTGLRKEETRFFAGSGNVLCQGVVLKYRVIQRGRDDFPSRMMSRLLKVSSSGYFDWEGRADSARKVDNEGLLERRLPGIKMLLGRDYTAREPERNE